MRALAAQATQAEAEAAAAARTQQRAMIAQMRADNDRLLEAIEQQRQRDVAEEAARQGWCAGAAVPQRPSQNCPANQPWEHVLPGARAAVAGPGAAGATAGERRGG